MKNCKKTDQILNELRRQGCTIKEKKNNVLIVPPDPTVAAYTLHRNDQHVGALVDYCLKRYNHFLNFQKLKKYHKRFGSGPKN